MKRLLLSLFLAIFAVPAFAQTGMTVRAYRLSEETVASVRERMQSPTAERYFAQRPQRADESLTEGLRFFLERSGVPLPDGTKVEWNAVRREVIVLNTDENHMRVGRALTTRGDCQVEITASWVAFAPADIETLARARAAAAPTMADIAKLWQDKKGTLLHAGTVVARHGENSVLSSGTEMNYAEKFSVVTLSDPTNEPPVKGPAHSGLVQSVVPEMATRHAGLRIQVTPEIQEDLATIGLSLEPELSSPPQWRETTIGTVARNGRVESIKMDAPQLHRQTMTTRVLVRDGATLAVGGMPSAAGDQRSYLFVSARLVDTLGLPFAQHDFKGRLLD